MSLDIGSILVSVLITIVITAISIVILSNKYIMPSISSLIDGKMKDTETMMRTAAATMGKKSGETRQIKKMEKMMVEDILKEYPEIELALEYFSPETAEMIKAHPERALILLQRYRPLIEKFMGRTEETEETEEKVPPMY